MTAAQAPPRDLARLDRLKAAVEELKVTLPWNCATPEDRRLLRVYDRAEERYLEAWCEEILMTTIPKLVRKEEAGPREPTHVVPKKRGRTPPPPLVAPGSLIELGKSIRAMDEFATTAVIRTEERDDRQYRYNLSQCMHRLEKGVLELAGIPHTAEGDAKHDRDLDYWLDIRTSVKNAMHPLWQIAKAARAEFQRLTPADQDEAHTIWGPIRGEAEWDYFPLMSRVWPYAKLRQLDNLAVLEGMVNLSQPFAPQITKKGRTNYRP